MITIRNSICLGFDPNGSEYLLSHSVDSYRFEVGKSPVTLTGS